MIGNLLDAVAQDHIWSKAGVGTLAIQGTASTEVGAFNITNGTVAVNAMNALNATLSGGVQIGGGSFGWLNYLGASGWNRQARGNIGQGHYQLGHDGRIRRLILANQQQNAANTAPSALTLTSSIAATGAVSKNFYLGGYNNTVNAAVVNQIQGVLEDNSTANVTSLLKGGSGTWLYAPAPASYVTAAPTDATTGSNASGGAASTNSFVVSSATGLVVGESVSGTDVPANSIITAINGTTIFLNTNVATAIASLDCVDLRHGWRGGRPRVRISRAPYRSRAARSRSNPRLPPALVPRR